MFVMAVLCVTRTLSLVKPLHVIQIWHLVLCLSVYFVFLVTTRVIGVESVSYESGHMFCTATNKADLVANHVVIFTDITKILVPVVPSIAGCVITIVHLRSSRQIRGEDGATRRHIKHEAIITVVILTVIFLIVTIPHFLLLIFNACCTLSREKFCVRLPSHFLHYLFCFYVPTLNSACNPLVYLIRIRKLRTYSLKILTCGSKSDSVAPSEHENKMGNKFTVAVDSPGLRTTPRNNMRRQNDIVCKTNEIQ